MKRRQVAPNPRGSSQSRAKARAEVALSDKLASMSSEERRFFYATLSPDQREAARVMFPELGGRWRT